MEVIVLGSSAAIPTSERNLLSIALKYQSKLFLFDCGEDLQRRFIDANLKFNKFLTIFLTHIHGDHVIGLPGLLFRFNLIGRDAPVHIYGFRNLFYYIFFHHKILGLKADYPFHVWEIDHQNQKIIHFEGLDSIEPKEILPLKDNTILDTDKFSIKYTVVNHSVETFAYSFNEKPRYGKFNPLRAKELGIPEGKIYGELQKGNPMVIDGNKIDPIKEGIVGPKRSGRKFTYSGDTAYSENLIVLGKDSDILIHEATYSKELTEVAKENQHSTTIDAAKAAKQMNAKLLVLSHISSRYQDDANKLLKEARKIFPNTELGNDLSRFKIK
jgi:ribonuclease Z